MNWSGLAGIKLERKHKTQFEDELTPAEKIAAAFAVLLIES